ncbi:MAG TPA: hypothetical protein VL426_03145, partial [Candidatus Binatia bacterium]|nr:hypothetical protein [Candidatus Binatia bacterium]
MMPSMRRFLAAACSLLALPFFALPAAAAATPGSLIKASGPAVYYLATDGKRYVFPNEKTYRTWYADFSTVKTVSDAQLAAIAIGGNVTCRPGVRMLKIATDPRVYAVASGGTLRPVASEAAAATLYGSAWAQAVDDLPDSFFVNYKTGAAVNGAADFDPTGERVASPTIAEDRDLAPDWGGADPTKLALGDGKHVSSPQKGSVYSCQTSFNGGGAFADGPWIHGSTWDLTEKAHVDGNVPWPAASFSMTLSGANRTITTNGLPYGHLTGTYPIAATDDAYQYDRNPNSIKSQAFSFTLPAVPAVAASPSCVGGEVGISVTGVPIFNGFDAGGRDAVAHELQDGCGGHPQSSGIYHYHGGSGCV